MLPPTGACLAAQVDESRLRPLFRSKCTVVHDLQDAHTAALAAAATLWALYGVTLGLAVAATIAAPVSAALHTIAVVLLILAIITTALAAALLVALLAERAELDTLYDSLRDAVARIMENCCSFTTVETDITPC